MAIVINGSGTVTGLAVGGLPDGTVDDGTVASGIASSKLTGALPAISGASLTGFVKGQMPSGMVIQAVTAVQTATTTLSSTTGSWVTTGLTANITPQNTSSKVLVMVTGSQYNDTNDQTAGATIFRGSTNLGHADQGFMPTYINWGNGGGDDLQVACSATYLDSPSSSSAVTYAVYAKADKSTYKWNGIRTAHCTITLLEIAG